MAGEGTPGTLPDTSSSSPQLRSLTAAGAPSGLQLVVNERGRISQSVDATSNGMLDLTKPDGATVRKAYLSYATVPWADHVTTPLKLDGKDVPITNEIASTLNGWNYFADVTDLVKPTLDAAQPGQVSLRAEEPNPAAIDGEILTVIYDDPNADAIETVSLLYGSLNTTGDNYSVQLARPVDYSDLDTRMRMSLGISFSYQEGGSQQYSTVDVNGHRLTSSAGGEDDGAPQNGDLITVGGTGDSTDNPVDPDATPTDPRSDDELYSLSHIVSEGDSNITVSTYNPSGDDNVFQAMFEMNPPVLSIGTSTGSLAVTPSTQNMPLGVVATLRVANTGATQDPAPGVPASLDVLSGPNAGRDVEFYCTAVCGYGADSAEYQYRPGSDGGYGTDELRIYYDSNGNGTYDDGEDFGTASITWLRAVHGVGMGDSYSSGEGLDPYDSGTDDDFGSNRNQCHRSPYAYFRHAQPPGYGGPFVELAGGLSETEAQFIACAGAETVNIDLDGTRQYDEPGTQLQQAHLDDRTDLVTLTIGGNDIGFSDVLEKCALSDCTNPSTTIDGTSVETWAQQRLDRLSTHLPDTLAAIRARAPEASIVLLGYPRLFPTDSADQGCAALTPFNTNEQNWLNGNALKLNQVMSDSAAQAGVNYIPVLDRFEGHAVCGYEGGWINGLTAGNAFDYRGFFVGTGSFHPTQDGQIQGYAAALNEFLNAPSQTGVTPAGLPANPEPTGARSRLMAAPTSSATTEAASLGRLTVLGDDGDAASSCLPQGLVRQGAPVRVAGEGFAPGATVTIGWDPSTETSTSPVSTLGTLIADGDGVVAGRVATPAAARGSAALLQATGAGADGASRVLVKAVGVTGPCPGSTPQYSWTGFFAPVDNPPTVNTMNAGRAVPLKWSLGGDQGLDVLAAGSPSSVQVSCSTQTATDEVELTTTAGSSPLTYDAATDRYTYVWKTRPEWAGQCRRLTVSLDDGSSHSALFQFR